MKHITILIKNPDIMQRKNGSQFMRKSKETTNIEKENK